MSERMPETNPAQALPIHMPFTPKSSATPNSRTKPTRATTPSIRAIMRAKVAWPIPLIRELKGAIIAKLMKPTAPTME